MKYFANTLLIVFFYFIGFFMYSCKCSEEMPLVRNPKPWDKLILTVDDIEEAKAAKKKVKERITYSKFYNKFGKLDTATYLVERIFFNEDGEKEKDIQYLSSGEVDIAWEYEYERGLLKRVSAKNRFDQLIYERLVKYDKDWDEIEIKEYNQKTKDYNRSIINYYKNKLVKEIYSVDNFGNQLSRQIFEYKDKKLVKINDFDKLNHLIKSTELEYDSTGNLTKEIQFTKPFNSKTEKTIKYSNGRIYQIDESGMLITYDYSGNKIVKEHYYLTGVGPQRRFDYFYNKKGLLKTKVSVSGIGKPELHIYYRYKYY